MRIKQEDISLYRMAAQGLLTETAPAAAKAVTHMTAIQAQDFPMSRLAVSMRMRGGTDAAVQSAICRHEILRTHIMRPTWHLVPAQDIRWLTALTGPSIKAALRAPDKTLGITPEVVKKCEDALRAALGGGHGMSRDEIKDVLRAKGLDFKFSHLLMNAEADGVICSGAPRGNEHTYVLLAETVKPAPHITREKALALLAERYFTSHGPAKAEDMAWWASLKISEVRKGIELAGERIVRIESGENTYFMGPKTPDISGEKTLILLPAFDEMLVSYRDRGPSLSKANYKKVISSNGTFSPTIFQNGQVIGTWGRMMQKDKTQITLNFFTAPDKNTKRQASEAAQKYAACTGTKTEIVYGKAA